MKLFVLKSINNYVECIGVRARNITNMEEMMNLEYIGKDLFETISNNKFNTRYKLIFECLISDDEYKEEMVFRVEE